MQPIIADFDPISFLGIDTSQYSSTEEIIDLKNSLGQRMAQYIMLALSEELKDDQLDQFLATTSDEEKMEILKKYFLNLEDRIKEELENFKRDYQNTDL